MIKSYRDDFPIFKKASSNKPWVYLDTAASAQKPKVMIDAISQCYSEHYANTHRGIYGLSDVVTRLFEETRDAVMQFINANSRDEIIFCHGVTDAINLVASSFGRKYLKAGDEVILSEMEHHANIVPWYQLSKEIGIQLRITPINDSGELNIAAFRQLFTDKTKLVSVTHVSNVLGIINPAKEIVSIAHQHDVPVLLDGAQAVSHFKVDVQDLDCDFYVFSAHKCYGPNGLGILYGKRALLETLPPYQSGGHMIESVSFDSVTFAKPPYQFEAGTANIASVIGFHATLRYLNGISMHAIAAHDQYLLNEAIKRLKAIPMVRVLGHAKPSVGVISFLIEGIHPHDVGTILDDAGIMLRAGHHCAMPLMKRLKVPATVRASFGIYNNVNDVDVLVDALLLTQKVMA